MSNAARIDFPVRLILIYDGIVSATSALGRISDYLAGGIRDRGRCSNPALLAGLINIVADPVDNQADAHD